MKRFVRVLMVVGMVVLWMPWTTAAQSAEGVGTLVYFEGTVHVSTADGWTPAEIDRPLTTADRLRTGAGARADVEWPDGSTTVVGPGETVRIEALNAARGEGASSQARGLLDGFVDLFSGEADEAEAEAGAVRRSNASADAPQAGALYWKRHAPVSFQEAAQPYRQGDYAKALPKLSLFLTQNPAHPRAPYARFALGHAYVETQNFVQARATFSRFLTTHPDHPLADRARQVMDGLSAGTDG